VPASACTVIISSCFGMFCLAWVKGAAGRIIKPLGLNENESCLELRTVESRTHLALNSHVLSATLECSGKVLICGNLSQDLRKFKLLCLFGI